MERDRTTQHPDRTGAPTYRGRRLPRPDEDLEDQGLGFDVGTLLNRRQALLGLGLGAVALGLAACGGSTGSTAGSGAAAPASTAATAAATGEIPDETAGPYPGDGSNGANVLTRSGIVRSDIRSSFDTATGTASGVPMTLQLTISDIADGGKAFAGVAVYVWQCDRDGQYSLYSEGITDQNYLRGVQIADAAGKVTFTSIFPACYSGRWPHIHFEVYADQAAITDSTRAIATSQVALPEAVCDAVYATTGYERSVSNLSQVSLAEDNVFGDDEGASQLATVTGSVTSGYTVALAVGVDTTTTPAVAQGGGGGGAPGGAAGDGGPRGTPPTGASAST